MFKQKSVSFVASANLALTVSVILAIGCAMVIYGCAYEANSQLHLLQDEGRTALDTYLSHVSSHQLPFAAFMLESVTGHCYAHGALFQGAGFWVVLFVAPLVAAIILLARGFGRASSGRRSIHFVVAQAI
jgi:hypothetical protein